MRLFSGARGDRRSRWLAVVSSVSILGWAVPALLMLDRGFGIQDEGSYLLSYTFWRHNPYFVSGSKYFYGPVFAALGDSIPLLRLVRLAMVLGANACFAVCFLGWLGRQRGATLPASRTALGLLIVASGGMAYLWAPLTPGYYDLTADASLVLVSTSLLALGRAPRPPDWIPATGGVVAVVLLVTKPTAFLVLLLVVGVTAYGLARTSRAAALRYVGVLAAGVVATLAVYQLLVIPVVDLVTGLSKVSELTAVGTHGASYLIRKNLEDAAHSLVGAVLLGLPLLAGLLAARAAARGGNERAAGALLGGAAVVTVLLPFALGWHGGNHRGTVVIDVALAALLVAWLAGALAAGRPGARDPVGTLVAATLLLVPLLQAAGTNVALAFVALECAAMWVGLVLLTLARSARSPVMSTAVLLDLGVAVVATALICGSNTVMTPFRSDGITASRSRVPQLGLEVSPRLARQLEAVARALAPYVVPGSTPVLSMDRDAGLTYLVGGVPAGSPWNDPSSPTRTAGILELACDHGDVRRAPVLLLTRPVDHDVAQAMSECGFPFPADYRRLDVAGGPPLLTVYVPRAGR